MLNVGCIEKKTAKCEVRKRKTRRHYLPLEKSPEKHWRITLYQAAFVKKGVINNNIFHISRKKNDLFVVFTGTVQFWVGGERTSKSSYSLRNENLDKVGFT